MYVIVNALVVPPVVAQSEVQILNYEGQCRTPKSYHISSKLVWDKVYFSCFICLFNSLPLWWCQDPTPLYSLDMERHLGTPVLG